MGDAIFMEKYEVLQSLLEDAVCHGRRTSGLYSPLARLAL